MKLLVKGGRLIDAATKTDDILDVLTEDDKIIEVGKDLSAEGAQVIDVTGKIVFPGFIDMHVHLRDPGQTHKGDIETESRAAARGGVTTLLAMPNTTPVADNPEIINYVHEKAKAVGLTRVFQVGSVTKGMAGKELSDIEGMKKAGIIAISEDGKSVMDSGVYRKALRQAAKLDLTVLAHCEDINLVQGGVLNFSEKSKEFAVKGISNAVENIIEARDIMLAEETGARLHLCHCSTAESFFLVDDARARGVNISAEVCPHHFTLTDEDIDVEDGNYKMNPPLRGKKDYQMLREGLSCGVFDVISTDHAPHSAEEKARGFKGPFGIIGLETSASLTYTELVKSGLMTEMDMCEKMCANPAKILKLKNSGSIQKGYRADIVVFDPDAVYEIHADDFVGKAKNMPFEGREVRGRVVNTIFEGKVVYSYDSETN